MPKNLFSANFRCDWKSDCLPFCTVLWKFVDQELNENCIVQLIHIRFQVVAGET